MFSNLDHGNVYLVPGLEYGLEYAVQNLELMVDEHDLHRRRVLSWISNDYGDKDKKKVGWALHTVGRIHPNVKLHP